MHTYFILHECYGNDIDFNDFGERLKSLRKKKTFLKKN